MADKLPTFFKTAANVKNGDIAGELWSLSNAARGTVPSRPPAAIPSIGGHRPDVPRWSFLQGSRNSRLVGLVLAAVLALQPAFDSLPKSGSCVLSEPTGSSPKLGGTIVSEVLDSFQIEWHGNTVVVTPAANVDLLDWDLVEQAADLVMEPLAAQETPMVVVDLSRVGYFGSVFLALLLRCHKFVKKKGGELVLCGASETALDLLRITALDTIWAIYKTRDEAMQAVLS